MISFLPQSKKLASKFGLSSVLFLSACIRYTRMKMTWVEVDFLIVELLATLDVVLHAVSSTEMDHCMDPSNYHTGPKDLYNL